MNCPKTGVIFLREAGPCYLFDDSFPKTKFIILRGSAFWRAHHTMENDKGCALRKRVLCI